MKYIASPYTHIDHAIREQRFREVCRVTAELMRAGIVCFCPVAHSHPIATIGGLDAVNGEFWAWQDRKLLDACDGLIIVPLEGWMESLGVRSEIAYMRARGKPCEVYRGQDARGTPALAPLSAEL